MSLETVISSLVTVLDNVTGIQAAYQQPPANPDESVFPFALVYIGTGEIEISASGLLRGWHNLIVEIHQSRTLVPAALTAVQVWPERIAAALAADATLNAAGGMIAGRVAYQAGPMEYGNYTHYTVRFTVPIKVH